MDILCVITNPGYSETIVSQDNDIVFYTAILIKDQDSKLQFTFSDVIGMGTFPKDGQIQIKIPKILLKSADPSQLLSTKAWSVVMGQDTNLWVYQLTALADIPFGDKSFAINFQQLKGNELGADEVIVHYQIPNGPSLSNSSPKLFVLNPNQPSAGHLTDALSFTNPPYINEDAGSLKDDIWLSPVLEADQGPNVPISNNLHMNIKFEGNDSLVPNGTDASKAYFAFSFPYGSASADLTDKKKATDSGYNALTSAWSIKFNLAANNISDWQVERPNTADFTPSWKIAPTPPNVHLFDATKCNLDVNWTHIISVVAGASTSLFVSWFNIPGYNDGVFVANLLKKQASPELMGFSGPNGQKTFQWDYTKGGVPLQWKGFGAPKIRLTTGSSNIPFQRDFDLWSGGGQAPELVYCGGFPKDTASECGNLSDFQLVPLEIPTDYYVQLLDGNGKTVGDQMGPVSVSLTNLPAYKLPVIKSFEVQLVRTGNDNELQFNWSFSPQAQNIYVSTIRNEAGKIIYGGFDTQFVLPVDNENPMDYVFELSVSAFSTQPVAKATARIDWQLSTVISPILDPIYKIVRTPDGTHVFALAFEWIYCFKAEQFPVFPFKTIRIKGESGYLFSDLEISADGKYGFVGAGVIINDSSPADQKVWNRVYRFSAEGPANMEDYIDFPYDLNKTINEIGQAAVTKDRIFFCYTENMDSDTGEGDFSLIYFDPADFKNYTILPMDFGFLSFFFISMLGDPTGKSLYLCSQYISPGDDADNTLRYMCADTPTKDGNSIDFPNELTPFGLAITPDNLQLFITLVNFNEDDPKYYITECKVPDNCAEATSYSPAWTLEVDQLWPFLLRVAPNGERIFSAYCTIDDVSIDYFNLRQSKKDLLNDGGDIVPIPVKFFHFSTKKLPAKFDEDYQSGISLNLFPLCQFFSLDGTRLFLAGVPLGASAIQGLDPSFCTTIEPLK